MKKLVLASLLILSGFLAMAQQAGRVKISFAGFRCLRETADDFLHLDGKMDEVFFRFYFTIADRNGNTKLKYSNQTDVYGDNHGPFGNRINAGSALDLFGNLKGGIKAGDNYSCNNIIGEYDLEGGDVLTLVPTIWEWDPGSGYQTSFDATIEGSYPIMNQKASALSNQRFSTASISGSPGADVLGLILIDAGSILTLRAAFDIIGELTPKPRPVGITLNGDYSPKAVLFNANIMQRIASSNFGYGPGVIPVQYNEEALGNSRDHGNYIILLKVDFTPKPGTSSVPPPPPPPSSQGVVPKTPAVSNKTNNPAPPPPPVFTKNTKNPSMQIKNQPAKASPSIAGTWTGTYGNGESSDQSYYSFLLNADGTMSVLAQNGSVLAKGNYSFKGNELSGTYTYTNSGSFSFTAVMDANGKLTGTWGSGSNVRGGGRWIMVKK